MPRPEPKPSLRIETKVCWEPSAPHLRPFHQRGVENDALRIADFGDRFNHAVILCLTVWHAKRAANSGARARIPPSRILYSAVCNLQSAIGLFPLSAGKGVKP